MIKLHVFDELNYTAAETFLGTFGYTRNWLIRISRCLEETRLPSAENILSQPWLHLIAVSHYHILTKVLL